jgi:hypothetical protein
MTGLRTIIQTEKNRHQADFYDCRKFVEDVSGGASRDRTDDLAIANGALSQLSYSPT